jgi:hypothetical protein
MEITLNELFSWLANRETEPYPECVERYEEVPTGSIKVTFKDGSTMLTSDPLWIPPPVPPSEPE